MLISPVCHSDGPGGAERYLSLLFGRLAAHGHDVHLIGDVPGWPFAETDVAFSPKWSRRTRPRDVIRLPAERRAVARVADALGPGLFHAQFKREQIAFTGLLADRAPVVWTEHGRFPDGRFGQVLAGAYRRAARRVSAIICVSAGVAEQIAAIVGPSVALEVIPNAIDTEAVRPPSADERTSARAALDLPPDATVVAWVGRLAAGKRPDLAVRAGAELDGVLLMAGSGPGLESLAREADAAGVRLLGHLTDPGVVYRAADAFLFTSSGRGEGLPYSVLEAAAHDLPIVVNAGAGLAEELRGAAVTVVDDSAAALADALAGAASRGESRAWAIEHDLVPWAARHAELFASLARV